MLDSVYSNEAVIFFEEGVVSKEMTYSEFEAILDGVVGLDDFAGETMDAVFVIINGQLKITGAVFFTVSFDRQGFADRSWNLPLRHLVETGGSGPDLGAGPIRLSCKSQCSVSWHAESLWDPVMSPRSNSFVRLRDAIADNRLCLAVSKAVSAPVQRPADPRSTPDWDVESPAQAPQSPSPDDDAIFNSGWSGNDQGLSAQQLAVLETEHRNKMAALIKQQRLQLQALKNEAQERLQSNRLVQEKEIQVARIEVERLRSEQGSLHSQNLALREQNEAQRKQVEALTKARELELQTAEKAGKAELDALRKQYNEQMKQKLQEETAKLKEDIELRNMELMYRHDVAKQLREELTQLRKDKIRLVHEGGDKFLERLEDLGISFIAFHPGAGHVSIALKDMPSYMENPIAYAANKCLVSEEHYRMWLSHYHKPECQAPLSHDKVCGCRIARIDVPSQFVTGNSDRCEKHKPRSFGDNVVNLHA
ncbi:MAG: chromosome partitioning protein ParA [Ketobacter sp.]